MALSTVALPAHAQELPQEPVPTSSPADRSHASGAAQMIEALDKMAATACENSELFRASADRFAETVRHYAHELRNEESLSAQRAIEIRTLMERTVLKPTVVEGALQLPEAASLSESLAALYRVLLPKLIALRGAEEFLSVADLELEQHYQRLLRVTSTAAAAEKHRFVEVLVDYYGNSSLVPMFKVFVHISELAKSDPELLSKIAIEKFDLIGETFVQRLSQFLHQKSPEDVKCFFAVHRELSRAITYARDNGGISKEEYERLDQEIGVRCIEPLVRQLFPVWITADYQRRSAFAGHCLSLLGASPLSNEAARERPDSTTQSVIDLLAAWRGDRHALGTTYFDGLDSYRAQHGASKELGYASIGMLPLLAPEPHRKGYIVEALRAGLVDDAPHDLLGSTADRPSQVGRILALCLLSDHLFFATEANTTYDPVVSSSLIVSLRGNQLPISTYEGVLTPAQALFIDLVRLAQGGESASSVPWIAQYDARSQKRISDRAQAALTRFMYEAYRCKEVTAQGNQAVSPATTVLSIPWEWGSALVRLPGQDRQAQWKESQQNFLTLADIIFEEVVRARPVGSSVFDVSVRINTALDIVRTRASYQDRFNPDKQCTAVQVVKQLYSEPAGTGRPPVDTYFTTLKQTVIDLQRAAQRSSQRVSAQSEIERNAHLYVEKLQRLCMAEFLQQEINIAGLSASAQSGPITRELGEACEQFGFIERDPYLVKILAEKTVSEVLERAREYSQQLSEELRALVEEMEIRATLE